MSIDYEKGRRHLMRRDPVLARIIRRVGPCGLGALPDRDAFVSLLEAIASQQLSAKAADTIFCRFCDLFPPDRSPDPARIARLDDAAIRAAGFSGAKIGYVRDLAAHVADGRLDLAALESASDADVMAMLTRVKGIGRWTAEMFLIFRLKRPDVFAVDDLGLVNAVQRAYALRARPSPRRLDAISEGWRPYRSLASWYLWKSLALPAESAARAVTSRQRST
ncbi:MAG: DNA-3-methyladenine glycosylase [Acidobacteria bacterium]|nr:DNA-3-methyladenine glycosylase [Acidobacteriota bacterium]